MSYTLWLVTVRGCHLILPAGWQAQLVMTILLTWHGAATGTAGSLLSSTGAEGTTMKYTCVGAVLSPHGHSEWRALQCWEQEQRTAPYEWAAFAEHHCGMHSLSHTAFPWRVKDSKRGITRPLLSWVGEDKNAVKRTKQWGQYYGAASSACDTDIPHQSAVWVSAVPLTI